MAHFEQLNAAKAAMEADEYGQAIALLEPLCHEGVPDAQSMLGVLYQIGIGVPGDGKRAVTLLRSAAEKGVGLAAHNLATLYATGAPGIEPDPELSRHYLLMARNLGVNLLPADFY